MSLAAPSLGTRSALTLAVLALATACSDTPAPGFVRFGIDLDLCDDYCLSTVRVALYEETFPDLPLGPPLQSPCGEDLLFASLPAGLSVFVTVEGYDTTGELILSGRSAPTTVVATRQTDLTVPLTATNPPTITAVSPDPLVLATTTAFTIEGDNLSPFGAHSISLDATPLDATWTPSTDSSPELILAAVSATSAGSTLTARRCGVDSTPFPVRIIHPTPGFAAVSSLPICAGGAPVAASAPDAVFIAWRCDDPSSAQLLEFTVDDPVCPLDPATTRALAANPTALAASATSIWVARTSAPIVRFERASTTAPTFYPSQPDTVLALAAADTAYALFTTGTSERLARLDPDATIIPISGFPELRHHALAATPSRLWVAASTADGEGRLLSFPTTATATAWPIPCTAPSALATSPDDQTVAIACASTLVIWDVGTSTSATIPLTAHALAFTDPDLLFAASDRLAVVTTSPVALLTELPATTTSLTPLPDRRLLAWSTSVEVLTPMSPLGPCPEPRAP